MPQILFRNMNLLDPRWNEARGGYEVLVEGDLIKEVSSKPIKAPHPLQWAIVDHDRSKVVGQASNGLFSTFVVHEVPAFRKLQGWQFRQPS